MVTYVSRNFFRFQTFLVATTFFSVIYCGLKLFIRPVTENVTVNHITQNNMYDSSKPRRCLYTMSKNRCTSCLKGWYGRDCGIPPHPDHVTITERQTAAYIVQITIVNHEIDMLKLKIDNSLPYTDEFIVIGDKKTLL